MNSVGDMKYVMKPIVIWSPLIVGQLIAQQATVESLCYPGSTTV